MIAGTCSVSQTETACIPFRRSVCLMIKTYLELFLHGFYLLHDACFFLNQVSKYLLSQSDENLNFALMRESLTEIFLSCILMYLELIFPMSF